MDDDEYDICKIQTKIADSSTENIWIASAFFSFNMVYSSKKTCDSEYYLFKIPKWISIGFAEITFVNCNDNLVFPADHRPWVIQMEIYFAGKC